MGGFQHRGTPQGMAHQYLGACVVLLQERSGRLQVRDVGGEGGVGEHALAFTQAREVEAQGGDAFPGQGPADVHGGAHVLTAGEAVGVEGVGPGIAVGGRIQASGQHLTLGVGEADGCAGHGARLC